ncbi:TPA: DUF551 domain-containing protein [Serratia marcescens]
MTLTTERLREIAEDGFLEHGDAKLMARELLANREAQPVGFRYRHKDTVSWLYNDWRWPDSVEAEQCQIEWLYTAQPAPAVQKDVEAVVGLLESGEWAEHCTNTELGQRLESAVTALMTNAPPAPAVPICFIDAIDDMENVMAWILRLPVPTEGATAKAGRLKNSIDACRAAMLAQPVSQGYKLPDGWIACSERMPASGGDKQTYVLAGDFKNHYWPNLPNTQVGVYGDWFNDGNPTWDDGDGNDLHLKEVTHWMPLPAAPGGGNG